MAVVADAGASPCVLLRSPLDPADSFKRYHRFHEVELHRVFPATVRQGNERFASENIESPKCNCILRNLFWVLDWILWKDTGR